MKTAEKMKTKIACLLTGVFLAMSLTGCAENQIPDISDEQMTEIKNYVAMTVMKYNMGRSSRLVDLSKYSDIETAPEMTQDDVQGMAPVDDTPVVNAPEKDETDSSGAGSVSYRIEEVLGLPEGVTLVYQGEGIYDSYPEDIEDGGFYMGASEGMKLLVISFLLSNTGEQDQNVNFGFPEVIFRVTVNGEYRRNALTTMLPGDMDMLTFDSVVTAGSSMEVVLVIEVNQDMEDNISSLDLGVQKESKLYNFSLKKD